MKFQKTKKGNDILESVMFSVDWSHTLETLNINFLNVDIELFWNEPKFDHMSIEALYIDSVWGI
jgi:hypothetical protein